MTAGERRLTMPQLGDENTVFADGAGTAQDYIPGVIGLEEMRRGIRETAEMNSVADIRSDDLPMSQGTVMEQALKVFNEAGGTVYNSQLGDVILNKRGVKSDIAHGLGPEKTVAFAAVPSVIQNGKVVDFRENWKDRGYDTAVIAAPITIDGEAYMAGVVLKRSNSMNRFYVHEVITEKRNTAVLDRGHSKMSGESGGDVPSVNSILARILDVKNNRSTEDIMPKLTGGQNSIGRSFSELVANQRDGVELHHAENGGCGRQRDRR
ncbi:LPD3 domain-containing protein [Dysosmobacter sp.]